MKIMQLVINIILYGLLGAFLVGSGVAPSSPNFFGLLLLVVIIDLNSWARAKNYY